MFALTNYYCLYQELCVFVYRPVKKLNSAPLNTKITENDLWIIKLSIASLRTPL